VEQDFHMSAPAAGTRSSGPAGASAPAPGTQSIDRAGEMLARLLESEEPMSLRDLAEAADLPKSTASRLLTALERHGLVHQAGERGKLEPGPAILRFAHRGGVERHLVELAHEYLEAISQASDETVNLSVPTPLGVDHLAQVDGLHFLGAGQWVGRRVDYHCTANGKVFLAYGSAELPPGPGAGAPPHPARGPPRARTPARGHPPRWLRDGHRRARGRPQRHRRAGARPHRPRHRCAEHLRPHAAPHERAPGRARAHPRRAGNGALAAPRQQQTGRKSRMTHEEILQQLYDDTLVGKALEVRANVEAGLADGLEPDRILFDALIPSLEEVGARFERGDYFVPEMLIAARAMQGALDILRPLLAETGANMIGTFLMGTVKGDVHDIGKNLCNIMLEGAGFTVVDLGVNVAPEKFVEEVERLEPDIVGFSAFLTTTMPMFKANINALEKAGLRDRVIVMVGGAPVTQEYADAVGADGYSADASTAVRKAKELIELRRASVAA
jgi:methylmalonyl-CoA mutase cobalamin-binding domain/chain